MLREGFLRAAACAAVSIGVAGAVGCSGVSDGSGGTATPTAAAVASGTQAAGGPALLQGSLTLDGTPAASQFLGVRVVRDGLAAACQRTIPTVAAGRYQIGVLDEGEMRGCGAPGSRLLLWIYVNDTFTFSRETVPWPDRGGPAAFDARFSSSEPAGASTPVIEFKGRLFDRAGAPLPSGTLIEAYAGDVRSAVIGAPASDF